MNLEDLPTGVTATSTTIEAGHYAADLILMADADAPAFSPPTWMANGRAVIDRGSSPVEEVQHTIDPGGPDAGWITVTPEPNLKVVPGSSRVVIRPGRRVTLKLAVDRRPPFEGRVPIDVRNLPLGVRVLNVGLNGVLVTETQTEREVFLYAEPWAEPMERTFFAVGRCEPAGTRDSSAPIQLVVEPTDGAPVAAAVAP